MSFSQLSSRCRTGQQLLSTAAAQHCHFCRRVRGVTAAGGRCCGSEGGEPVVLCSRRSVHQPSWGNRSEMGAHFPSLRAQLLLRTLEPAQVVMSTVIDETNKEPKIVVHLLQRLLTVAGQWEKAIACLYHSPHWTHTERLEAAAQLLPRYPLEVQLAMQKCARDEEEARESALQRYRKRMEVDVTQLRRSPDGFYVDAEPSTVWVEDRKVRRGRDRVLSADDISLDGEIVRKKTNQAPPAGAETATTSAANKPPTTSGMSKVNAVRSRHLQATLVRGFLSKMEHAHSNGLPAKRELHDALNAVLSWATDPNLRNRQLEQETVLCAYRCNHWQEALSAVTQNSNLDVVNNIVTSLENVKVILAMTSADHMTKVIFPLWIKRWEAEMTKWQKKTTATDPAIRGGEMGQMSSTTPETKGGDFGSPVSPTLVDVGYFLTLGQLFSSYIKEHVDLIPVVDLNGCIQGIARMILGASMADNRVPFEVKTETIVSNLASVLSGRRQLPLVNSEDLGTGLEALLVLVRALGLPMEQALFDATLRVLPMSAPLGHKEKWFALPSGWNDGELIHQQGQAHTPDAVATSAEICSLILSELRATDGPVRRQERDLKGQHDRRTALITKLVDLALPPSYQLALNDTSLFALLRGYRDKERAVYYQHWAPALRVYNQLKQRHALVLGKEASLVLLHYRATGHWAEAVRTFLEIPERHIYSHTVRSMLFYVAQGSTLATLLAVAKAVRKDHPLQAFSCSVIAKKMYVDTQLERHARSTSDVWKLALKFAIDVLSRSGDSSLLVPSVPHLLGCFFPFEHRSKGGEQRTSLPGPWEQALRLVNYIASSSPSPPEGTAGAITPPNSIERQLPMALAARLLFLVYGENVADFPADRLKTALVVDICKSGVVVHPSPTNTSFHAVLSCAVNFWRTGLGPAARDSMVLVLQEGCTRLGGDEKALQMFFPDEKDRELANKHLRYFSGSSAVDTTKMGRQRMHDSSRSPAKEDTGKKERRQRQFKAKASIESTESELDAIFRKH